MNLSDSLRDYTLSNETRKKIPEGSLHCSVIWISYSFPLQVFNSYQIHQEAIKHRIGQMQLQAQSDNI